MEESEISSSLSAKIDVNIASTPKFNVIANMEGPNRQYLNFIEKKTNCKILVTDNTGISYDGKGPAVTVSIVGDDQESIDKAKDLLNNLIQTIEAQKQRQIQLKAAKKAKKKSSELKAADLPQALIIGMKYYFPGPPNEPPPPGTTADLKMHKRYFKQTGKEQKWF